MCLLFCLVEHYFAVLLDGRPSMPHCHDTYASASILAPVTVPVMRLPQTLNIYPASPV